MVKHSLRIHDLVKKLGPQERAAVLKTPELAADDLAKTAHDRKFIDLEHDHEVRWWIKSLGCTHEQLEQAVKAVGSSPDKVRAYLRRE